MPTGWERREVPCGDIGSDTSMWHVARHAASSVLMQRERNRWGPSSYPDARPTVRQASGQRMGGRRVCTTRLDPTAALPSSPRSPSPPSGPRAVGGSRSDQLAARSDEEDEVSCRPPVSPLPRRPRTRDPARYPRTARHRRGTRAWMIRSRPRGADGALRMRRSAAIATHAVHTTSRATSRRHESHLARARVREARSARLHSRRRTGPLVIDRRVRGLAVLPEGAVRSPRATHNPTRKGCRTLAEALACTARPLKADTRSGVEAIACMMCGWVWGGGGGGAARAHNPRPRHRSAVAIHARAAAPPVVSCQSMVSALYDRHAVPAARATCATRRPGITLGTRSRAFPTPPAGGSAIPVRA